MPIRINLLAESQAAEELRRRDPVKRAIWVAICIVVVVLVWSSSVQVRIMTLNGKLSNLETGLSRRTNDYTQILANQKKLLEVNAKLAALNHLAANRFLQATLLDALQHSPVEGIQINHLRTEQTFDVTPETKPTTLESGKVIPGKPGTSTEKTKLVLGARTGSANPAAAIVQVNKFKGILSQTAYFQTQQIGTNNIAMKSLTEPSIDNESQTPFVLFSLECQYADHTR